MNTLRVTLWEGERELWSGEVIPPLELGRQTVAELAVLAIEDHQAYRRLAIAPFSIRSIPRQAIRVESQNPDELRIVNLHKQLSFGIGESGESLQPTQVYICDRHTRIAFPERRMVEISIVDESPPKHISSAHDSANYRTIEFDANYFGGAPQAKLSKVLEGEHGETRGRAAVDLIRLALEVVRKAAGSDEFFDAACAAAADMVDLSRVMVLLYENGKWQPRAVKIGLDSRVDAANVRFSQELVSRVLSTGKTVIYDPSSSMASCSSSMMLLDVVVASPITGENGKLIGVLYGDRDLAGSTGGRTIGELEAALLDVLAGAVSSGLARQREEQRRASLTQFFSPRIAELLECNQDLLTGQDAEVTVLFCDIRGFSSVAERVGPQITIEWINDVLTELSQCVMRHDGVLVDYIGDELMAMWGAPGQQLDHAARACLAVCEMLDVLEPLRERWREVTPEGFGFGIGVNTGMARVGNTGSRIKFKYGPLGSMVNVASRVQGVTKYAGVRALITGATAAAIQGKSFDLRRISTVEVVGIKEQITLLQLAHDEQPKWHCMRDKYEAALACYEGGNYSSAASLLATLVHEYPEDQPSLILLGRVVGALIDHSKPADPVWRLLNK